MSEDFIRAWTIKMALTIWEITVAAAAPATPHIKSYYQEYVQKYIDETADNKKI